MTSQPFLRHVFNEECNDGQCANLMVVVAVIALLTDFLCNRVEDRKF